MVRTGILVLLVGLTPYAVGMDISTCIDGVLSKLVLLKMSAKKEKDKEEQKRINVVIAHIRTTFSHQSHTIRDEFSKGILQKLDMLDDTKTRISPAIIGAIIIRTSEEKPDGTLVYPSFDYYLHALKKKIKEKETASAIEAPK